MNSVTNTIGQGDDARGTIASSALLSPSGILLMCYHYAPSSEVGARRIVAIAKFLAAQDIDIVVVNCSGSSSKQILGEYKITEYGVAEPKPVVVTLLVRLKRLLRQLGLFASDSSDRSHRAAAAAENGPPNRSMPVVKAYFFNVVHLIDDHKKWALMAALKAIVVRREHHFSAILASGPPMSTLLAASWASRWLKLPLIVDLRDPWLSSQSHPKRLESWLPKLMERIVINRAAAVTCTSPGLTLVLRKRYPRIAERIHTVMNGYDGMLIPRSHGTGGRLCIVYAGALYYNRNPFPFFEALEHLLSESYVDSSRIEVILVGDCRSYNGVDIADSLRGTRSSRIVTVLPPVSPSKIASFYEKATVLLNFAQGQPIQVPAKTFEQLIEQRELLLICEDDSDTARIGKQIEGITVVQPNDTAQLTHVLHDLYARHVTQGILTAPAPLDVAKFSRAAQNVELLKIIQQVTRSQMQKR